MYTTEVDGKIFASKSEVCRYYNIPQSTFHNRLLRGCSLEEASGLVELQRKERKDKIHEFTGYIMYEIKNLVNGKIYIGITVTSLRRRWSGHVYNAKKSKTHLYQAMRKYGVHNFEMNILRNDAKSGYELQQQEIEEIGYNIAPGGGMAKGKAIEIAGLKFRTQSEAANYYGISVDAFNLRLSRLKWTPEQAAEIEPPPNSIPYKIDHEGEVFSLNALCKKIGKVNYKAAHLRVTNGWTMYQAVGIDLPPETARTQIKVEFEGVVYSSLKSAAKAYGVDYSTVHNRLKYQNVTIEQALGLQPIVKQWNENGKSITAFGQTYKSMTACAKANGVPPTQLVHRLYHTDETPEVAIEKIKSYPPKKKYTRRS